MREIPAQDSRPASSLTVLDSMIIISLGLIRTPPCQPSFSQQKQPDGVGRMIEIRLRPSNESSCRGPGTLSPPRKRSEGETNTDHRSNVVVVEIGDAGAMRNGDGQTAAHDGIRNSGENVETLGEVMIRIERQLVESARAGTAETGSGRAGRRNTEVVLPLLIPGQSDVGFVARRISRPSTRSAPSSRNQDCRLRRRSGCTRPGPWRQRPTGCVGLFCQMYS